jgi:hypothetical protein
MLWRAVCMLWRMWWRMWGMRGSMRGNVHSDMRNSTDACRGACPYFQLFEQHLPE